MFLSTDFPTLCAGLFVCQDSLVSPELYIVWKVLEGIQGDVLNVVVSEI